jgi:glycosyltransferase involved in cell wall biosynthesis
VFVPPSEREGLPNALLEAMASGLACVAAEIPGVTTWLLRHDDNGLLHPVQDVGALRALLTRLIDDEDLRRRLGARARASIVDGFTTKTLADAHFDLYTAAASGA